MFSVQYQCSLLMNDFCNNSREGKCISKPPLQDADTFFKLSDSPLCHNLIIAALFLWQGLGWFLLFCLGSGRTYKYLKTTACPISFMILCSFVAFITFCLINRFLMSVQGLCKIIFVNEAFDASLFNAGQWYIVPRFASIIQYLVALPMLPALNSMCPRLCLYITEPPIAASW